MKTYFASLSYLERISWALSLGAFAGMIVSAFFLPGGDDLYRYYLPFERGCFECGYVPYYAQWFLSPLHVLPTYPYAWPIWVIFNIVVFAVLLYWTHSKPFLFVFSFPFLGQIWLGQIDVFICLGLLIFLLAKNPYFRGLGIILALIKPQLSLLPIFLSLLLENRKAIGKLLTVPTLILLISIFVYGPGWPIDWASNAMTDLPVHVWRLASIDIWKIGLVLIPLPLLIKDQRKRLEAGLLVAALATPFFGVYSYVTFLILNSNWWTLILSYAWVVGYYWLGESAMRFAWSLPLFMLVMLMYELRIDHRNSTMLQRQIL
jgi:hypothetical protein